MVYFGLFGSFRFIQSTLIYFVHLVPLGVKNGKIKIWVETSTYSKSDFKKKTSIIASGNLES